MKSWLKRVVPSVPYPRESTLCYVNNVVGYRRRKGTPTRSAPLPEETRMGVMDMIILILKLIVAVLQLLDAVLKYFR
jgi:small toxic protein TisB